MENFISRICCRLKARLKICIVRRLPARYVPVLRRFAEHQRRFPCPIILLLFAVYSSSTKSCCLVHASLGTIVTHVGWCFFALFHWHHVRWHPTKSQRLSLDGDITCFSSAGILFIQRRRQHHVTATFRTSVLAHGCTDSVSQ